jgi:hypothetical protein
MATTNKIVERVEVPKMTNWLLLENRIRATPLNLLEQGLTERNWECISVMYTMLTGQPAPNKETCEQLVTAIANGYPVALPQRPLITDSPSPLEDTAPPPAKKAKPKQEEEDDEDDDDDEEEEEPKPQKKKKSRFDKVKKVNVEGEENRFVDDGMAAVEDLKFMPKDISPEKLRQRRPDYKKVKVRCKKCGTCERVDPMLAPKSIERNYKMRYVCNTCSSGG